MKSGRVLCVVVCLLPQSVPAQEVSGSLQGRAVTPHAEPVAEVRVTIAGPSLQGTRTSQTDLQGFFQMLALPAGSYTVRLARIGFRPVVVDSVPVRIGSTTNLGLVTLEPQALELGEIVVSGRRFSIDPASTTIGANVDATTYDALPVGRDYRSVVAFLPHANTSYYTGDPVNIGGATGLENAYFIDGLNVTDDHFQGVVSTLVLPYNFVRSVEVKEGGYDARYGRAIGGLVNAVTYSGGNTFEGDVFAFFTDRGLTGEQRTGFNDVRSDQFTNYDVGARVGGPIMRDRLWFSAAYNPQVESAERAVPGWGDFCGPVAATRLRGEAHLASRGVHGGGAARVGRSLHPSRGVARDVLPILGARHRREPRPLPLLHSRGAYLSVTARVPPARDPRALRSLGQPRHELHAPGGGDRPRGQRTAVPRLHHQYPRRGSPGHQLAARRAYLRRAPWDPRVGPAHRARRG